MLLHFQNAISIHKALAGLDISGFPSQRTLRISIHKALAGLDLHDSIISVYFLSISIHKALAGLDHKPFGLLSGLRYFNPQGPRGPRLHPKKNILCIMRFQSTRPSRAST